MQVKNYIKGFGLSLITIFFFYSLSKADSPATPWSEVITSSNGKYVLVLISPKVKEQEEYIFQSRKFWRDGGIPAEDVPEAEKELQEEIDAESAIRKKYPESGLYTAGKSPKLLWKIDLEVLSSLIEVSNDGEHIIALRNGISPIFEEKSLESNPNVKEITKVYPNMEEVALTFYSFGKPFRSYKASELVTVEDFQMTGGATFVWSGEGVLNEKIKTFSITKKNGEKLVFDITTGNLLSGKLPSQQNSTSKTEVDNTQPPKSENSKSFCGGIALLVGLILSFLFGR